MSAFFLLEGEMISFNEYYTTLEEGVKPTQTPFGTDLKNKQIGEKYGFFYTFFEANNLFYSIMVHPDGTVGFGASNNFSTEIADYNQDRRLVRSGTALKVFNKVFYVILEILDKKKNIKEVTFDGADPQLGKLYDKIVKNKYFLDSISKRGFKFKGTLGSTHYFQRK